MSAIAKFFDLITPKNQDTKMAEAYRQTIREAAKVGGKLFGPVPQGVRREFFCLDERTWVWHEEWKDASGKDHIMTTRYDVRPNGIFKAQNGRAYQQLSKQEMKNLVNAAVKYRDEVNAEIAQIIG